MAHLKKQIIRDGFKRTNNKNWGSPIRTFHIFILNKMQQLYPE